jgi:hypothetical protein
MEYITLGGMTLSGGFVLTAFIFAVWSLFWKGLALWHAARREQGWWFIVLLLVNTLGILEIVYLFGVLKLRSSEIIPKRALHG